MELTRSRYATPALVCGLLVFVPFVGFLSFVPAIILGILTLRERSKSGRGAGWAGIIFGGGALIVGALAVILGVAGTMISAAKSEPGSYSLEDGKLLMKAIEAASIDAIATGENFFPADANITQSGPFFDSLVKKEYLTESDLKRLKPDLLQAANVSFQDPKNTLVFVTRQGVSGLIVVGIKSGEVRAFRTAEEASEFAKVPPRRPLFLP